MVRHADLTGSELHEPKGITSAPTNGVYVKTSSGSGTWKKIPPTSLEGITANGIAGDFVVSDGSGGFLFASTAHGNVYFYNIASPYTLTVTSTAWQKVNATTVATGSPQLITEGTNARLTYTGTNTVDLDVVFNMSIDQSSGANKDIEMAVYKNGVIVAGSQVISTSKSGEKLVMSSHADLAMSTNDYVEVYAKNHGGSGDINVYTMSIMASTAGS
jgi:hypothetical protein